MVTTASVTTASVPTTSVTTTSVTTNGPATNYQAANERNAAHRGNRIRLQIDAGELRAALGNVIHIFPRVDLVGVALGGNGAQARKGELASIPERSVLAAGAAAFLAWPHPEFLQLPQALHVLHASNGVAREIQRRQLFL